MPHWTWDFYLIVGGSLLIAFVVILLGKLEDRRDAKKEAAS